MDIIKIVFAVFVAAMVLIVPFRLLIWDKIIVPRRKQNHTVKPQ